jgi:3-hydroxyisobutyrate dehydrogenase-like beta-hydroxyacid dehydrogenase
MKNSTTIALFGTGDMGAGVGRTLVDAGFTVVSPLGARSAASQERALAAGIVDSGGLIEALDAADLALSIMPPGHAAGFAKEAAAAMREISNRPIFADLNAISPKTMAGIAADIEAVGGSVLDGGIIGLSPDKACPRVYLSGPDAESVAAKLARPDMKTIALGPTIGQASTMKMLYAGLNKGQWAMMAAISVTAAKYDLLPAFLAELEANNAAAFNSMQNWVGFLAADAHRFGPEMDEIAETMASAGVTSGFHEGARWVYDLLDETPLRNETRATWDRERPLEKSVGIYLEALNKRG